MNAIVGSVFSFRSMADGCIRITIDFREAESRQAMALLCDVGAAVAIARLSDAPQDAQTPEPDTAEAKPAKAPYGQEAKALRLSSFFRTPAVWSAVGTDAEFLAWVRTQPCVVNIRSCGGDVVAAHVRRIANGAGIGTKPKFSAIPLCNTHHSDQHAHGESAIAPKEQWDKWRIEALQEWCWAKLKADLGREHWSEVEPAALRQWSFENSVDHLLPAEYKA